jgi:ribosomal protein S18 acetylase RimI-like enzyme
MTSILSELSTPALVDAIEGNLCAFPPLWRHWPAAEIHDGPELLWSLTSFRFPLFNSILRARLAPADADAAIAAVIARGRSKDVPLVWWTGPATTPADLGERLVAAGFTHAGEAPGMAADLFDLPGDLQAPSGLEVRQVAEAETLRHWCIAMAAGYEMPPAFGDIYYDCLISLGLEPQAPAHHYLGLLDGEPVASATLFLAAGVAGVYDVATVPAARRKGIGAALTVRPLRDAAAAGYRVGILHSSATGFSLYRRLGFREYCSIGQYVWPATATSWRSCPTAASPLTYSGTYRKAARS